MKRLIVTGALVLTLAGIGADVLASELGNEPYSGSFTASGGGPTVSFTPKPDPPCATSMSSAKSAEAGAEAELKLDHSEARISSSQLKALSGDLDQETMSAEQGGYWSGLCNDIDHIESEATAE